MIKYIDKGATRQHLIQRLYETALNDDENYLVYLYLINDRLQVWMDEIPVADVEEVRHGRWVTLDDEYIDECKCSSCGVLEYFNKGWKRFNYCPNCGCRMDLEGEEE